MRPLLLGARQKPQASTPIWSITVSRRAQDTATTHATDWGSHTRQEAINQPDTPPNPPPAPGTAAAHTQPILQVAPDSERSSDWSPLASRHAVCRIRSRHLALVVASRARAAVAPRTRGGWVSGGVVNCVVGASRARATSLAECVACVVIVTCAGGIGGRGMPSGN